MATLAKLTRPKLHGVVLRERLFAKLDEAREHYPVIWVMGPPGAGKTALIASYLDANKLPGAWYQVDSGDHDLSSFFYYLSRTVSAQGRRGEVSLPLLTSEYLGDIPGYTRHFFRQYFGQLPAMSVLGLDNYHDLPMGSALHAVLEQALREVPEEIQIIVMSREAPPKELAPLASVQRMVILDWDDLRLTLDEAKEIAGRRVDLSQEAIRSLYQLSGGWAAGWTLSLERVKQHGFQTEVLPDDALESVFNYFSGHLFRTSTPEHQDFLMRTALLPSMTAAAAERLSGNPRSADILEDLYRRRLFTDRRGAKPYVYHYHDLLKAFLLEELKRIYTTVGVTELSRRAGRLLEDDGQYHEAIALYLQAQDWDAASHAIHISADAMLEQGRDQTLRDWIAALPDTVVDAAPWLRYWMGMSLIASSPAAARVPLEKAYDCLAERGDGLGQILVCAGMVLTYWAEYANFTPLDRWIERLDVLLRKVPAFPSHTIELRVNEALVFALTYRRPDPALLAPRIARMEVLLSSAQVPPNDRVAGATSLLVYSFFSLRYKDGGRLVDNIRPLLELSHLTPFVRLRWLLYFGFYCWGLSDCARARRAFTDCLDICSSHGIALPFVNAYSHFGLALVDIELGHLLHAEGHRIQAECYTEPHRLLDSAMDTWIKALLAAARGERSEAVQRDREGIALAKAVGATQFIRRAYLGLAIHQIEAGAFDEGIQCLTDVRNIVQGTVMDRYECDLFFAEAYSAHLQGDQPRAELLTRRALQALKAVEDRLCLREYGGYAVMPRLFALALERGIETEYVRHLIRTFNVRAQSRAAANWPWKIKIYTLGQFRILIDEVPLEYARKAPKKPLQLLKVLVAFGGTGVAEQKLTDQLWPEEPGDNARNSLSATLSRLRKLLGNPDAIEQIGGQLSLQPDLVWVDAIALEQMLDRTTDSDFSQSPQDTLRMLRHYAGAFLATDAEEPWTVTTRERLRAKLVAAVSNFAREQECAGNLDVAIAFYRQGIEADELAEEFYRGLMRCYRAREERAEAFSVYRRLKRTLSVTLGITPSPATEQLANALRVG